MPKPRTSSRGQIQRAPSDRNDAAIRTIRDQLQLMAPAIKAALPKHFDPERMARIAMTAVRQDAMRPRPPYLHECSMPSFLGSVMTLAALGLEPNTPLGHAYLIPRRSKHTRDPECTFQIGYQGMIDLARRSGKVKVIYAHAVYEGDDFHYELGLDQSLRHVPGGDEDPASLTHVYAVARLGAEPWDRQFVVMTRAAVDRIRSRSAASSDGPWVTDYAEMAKKTAIRRLFKYLPKSIEMANAAGADEALEGGAPIGETFGDEVREALETTGHVVETEAPPEAAAEEQLEAHLTSGEGGGGEVLRMLHNTSDATSLLLWARTNAREMEKMPKPARQTLMESAERIGEKFNVDPATLDEEYAMGLEGGEA